MNLKIKENLREAGLTENEAKIYSTLIEFGPSHAGLISRKSGLHRRVVYDTVEMLIKKGLIGYIVQNNKKLFQAANPKRILELLKEKENYIQEIIPEMLEFYNQTKEKEETLFFKGKQGLKSVFEDQIAEGKEILIIDTSNLAYEMFDIYFHWFDKRRKERRIKTRIIFNAENKKGSRKVPLSEIKYLPKTYENPAAINIYGDKVAIIHWSKENPFAVIIKNKDISEGYRKYFDLMWAIAKK